MSTILPDKPTTRLGRQAFGPLDALLAGVLSLAAAVGVAVGFKFLDPLSLAPNEWFQADIGRVYANMTDRASDNDRAYVHPIFALLVHPIVLALQYGFGLSASAAVRTLLCMTAAAWIAILYAVLRLIGRTTSDAALFAILAAVSAASVFWFCVPETYPFGSLTILLALLAAAMAERRAPSVRAFALATAASLSVTITNVMAGIACALAYLKPKKAALAVGGGTALVLALALAQQAAFPHSKSFWKVTRLARETAYVNRSEAGGPGRILAVFWLHAIVAPDVETAHNADDGAEIVSVQRSTVGSAGAVGVIAAVLWFGLLVIGAMNLFSRRERPSQRFRLALMALLAGQLGLHLLYGEETFLYSLHYAPLLVLVASFALESGCRRTVRAVAVALVVCLAVNNVNGLIAARATAPSHRERTALRTPNSGHVAIRVALVACDELGQQSADN